MISYLDPFELSAIFRLLLDRLNSISIHESLSVIPSALSWWAMLPELQAPGDEILEQTRMFFRKRFEGVDLIDRTR
jgi:hypothetical protein